MGVHSQYLPMLRIALAEVRRAHLARQSILDIQQIQFDSNDVEHMQVRSAQETGPVGEVFITRYETSTLVTNKEGLIPTY